MEQRQWGGEERRISQAEHEDLKDRVRLLESKLDRMTWLIVATLTATIADIFTKLR